MSAESGSPSGWMDYFGQAIRTSVNYLPSQVSEVLTQSRDYAVAKLPVSAVKNVCAISTYVTCPGWYVFRARSSGNSSVWF